MSCLIFCSSIDASATGPVSVRFCFILWRKGKKMGPIWVRVARLFYETVGVSFHLQNSAMTAGRIRRGRRMAASGCLLPQGLVQQGYSPRFSFVFPKGKRGCICPASSITARPASNGTHPILHRQQTWRPLSYSYSFSFAS